MSATATLKRARLAKKKAVDVFSTLLGNVTVGITSLEEGTFGLKVNLASPPDPAVALPTEIDGVPVRVEVAGEIWKR
jgi:hypothetical protein